MSTMKDDKIVSGFAERIKNLQISPVIIESKDNKRSFMNVFEDIRSIFSPISKRNRKILSDTFIPSVFPIFTIESFRYVSGILPRESIFDLAESVDVEKIYRNGIKYAFDFPQVDESDKLTYKRIRKDIDFTTTQSSKKLMGMDIANQMGMDGRNITVGVVDTGTSRFHPQVRGRVDFNTALKLQRIDENGHGTWCGSCIAGSKQKDRFLSARIGRDIICEGMLPKAQLYSIKALGYGLGLGSDGGVIKAIDELIRKNIKVISLSLGGDIQEEKKEDDPYFNVFKKAREKGIIGVVAAGNSGPKPGTIQSPGWLDDVLTVGAYDPLTGKLADFSSRGPTPDGHIKPDCVAPGVNINSGCTGLLDYMADQTENNYSIMSGTSMATPHVAGLIAAAKSKWKSLTLDEIITILMENSEGKTDEYGFGPITWQMFTNHFGGENNG